MRARERVLCRAPETTTISGNPGHQKNRGDAAVLASPPSAHDGWEGAAVCLPVEAEFWPRI
jgi:hypothetical protein